MAIYDDLFNYLYRGYDWLAQPRFSQDFKFDPGWSDLDAAWMSPPAEASSYLDKAFGLSLGILKDIDVLPPSPMRAMEMSSATIPGVGPYQQIYRGAPVSAPIPEPANLNLVRAETSPVTAVREDIREQVRMRPPAYRQQESRRGVKVYPDQGVMIGNRFYPFTPARFGEGQ